MITPIGFTSQLEVMDVIVNKPFKDSPWQWEKMKQSSGSTA
jgi:hypothetical protein